MKRTTLGLLALIGAIAAFTSDALAATPWLDGTFKMRFVVLRAHNVRPGKGATGKRIWIFEHQGSSFYVLEGLANGAYARIRLHRSGDHYAGTGHLRAACLNHPSATGQDVTRYSIRVTRSIGGPGRLTATRILAYLHGTYGGCGAASAFELRRYTGRLAD
ncbi:MAG TPA: hypothetical protein VGF76_26000 [Polyangiaceae bacterium]|jgi:hypothetical protein